MPKIADYKAGFRATTSNTIDINQPLRVAQSVAGVANTIGSIAANQIQQEKRDNETMFSAKADADFKTATYDLMESVMSNPEFQKDPDKALSAFETQALDLGIDQMENAPTDRSRKFAQMSLESQTSQAKLKLKDWATKQKESNIAMEAEETTSSLGLLASRDTSLKNLDETLLQGSAYAQGLTEALGTAKTAKVKETIDRTILNSSFETMVFNNELTKAREVIKDEKYQKILGPDGLLTAKKLIKQKEEANQAKSDKLKVMKYEKPWDYLDAIGATKGLPTVNFADPKTIYSRQAFIENTSNKYQIDLTKQPLSPREVTGLAQYTGSLTPSQATQYFQATDEAVGEEIKTNIARQLFQKDPETALAMNMSSDDPDTAQAILSGKRAVREKAVSVTPKLLDKIQEKLIHAIPDDNFGRISVSKGAQAYYVAKAIEQGINPADQDYDEVLLQEAVDKTFGPVISLNTRSGSAGQVASYRDINGKYVDQDRFERIYDQIDDADLIDKSGGLPRNSNGQQIPFDKLKYRVQIQAAGKGKYFLKEPLESDGSGGLFLENADGSRYILDMKSITDFYEGLR